uniref:Ras-associating domain-containing protein n=1 Tax=Steinernema glaseri TaxID=37863 RepID=A0A1I8AHS1_9BILA
MSLQEEDSFGSEDGLSSPPPFELMAARLRDIWLGQLQITLPSERLFMENICPGNFAERLTQLASFVADQSITTYQMGLQFHTLSSLESLKRRHARLALRLAIASQICLSLSNMDASGILEEDVCAVNKGIDAHRFSHYENVLDGITRKIMDVLDENYSDLTDAGSKINDFVLRNYNDSNILILNRSCDVPSLHAKHIPTARSSLKLPGSQETQIHEHRNYTIIVHRSAPETEDRTIFEEDADKMEREIYIEASGFINVYINPDSAKNCMKRLQQHHRFPVTAAFVLKDKEAQCVFNPNFALIRKPGMQNSNIYVVFGF